MKISKKTIHTIMLIPALALTLAAAPVLAVDSHHPQSGTTPATKPTAANASMDMMANMKKMQGQMLKISATTDTMERAKLLDEHLKTMQATMQTMMKNGSCMDGGMSMTHGAMGCGNMMQMMMDQMMQHQNAMQAPA